MPIPEASNTVTQGPERVGDWRSHIFFFWLGIVFILTMLVVFPEDARLVGVILGDVVVLFDSIHRDDAGDVYCSASRPRFLGH
jgi:hypothetical protein